jgi:hypothetical protein
MLNFKRVMSRSLPILLVLLGFIGGVVVNQIKQSANTAQAQEGTFSANIVLEMGPTVTKDNAVLVMNAPAGTTQVDRLLWGDRVLWRGKEQADDTGNRWIYVHLSEGVSGWIMVLPEDLAGGKFINLSPQHFTTPGIDAGISTVTITDSGSGANLRNVPSVKGEIVQKLVAGEVYQVTEGPYQSEYFVWWELTNTTTGVSGWVVDVGGWLTVNQ